jgi:hypothetical protein
MAMSEEQKNKLVSLGALERVATALKTAANQAAAAAEAEASRALAAEQAIEKKADDNTAAIEILNGDDKVEGSVAKAVADAVKAEKDRAEGIEGGFATRIAANETFVAAQPGVDKAQNDRLALLEEMMGLGGAEGDKTAIEELQEDIETAQNAAEAAQKDVDNVELRLDAEGGLVDRIEAVEALGARLDGAVDVENSVKKQIADAVAVEQGRAEGQEAAIRQELANEKAALQKEIGDEKAALQAEIDADIVAERALRVAEEQRIEGLVGTEAQRADTEERRIVGLVEAEARTARAAEKANADAIDVLNGEEGVAGSVKQQIKDAIDGVKSDVTDGLAERMTTAEAALNIIQGTAEIAGSIAKAEKDAKDYADEKIAALVDSAPDAMNTLNELATAIGNHQDVYDAYVAEVSGELAKKVDKVEGSRLVAETEIAAFEAKAEVEDVTKCLQDAKDYADQQDAIVQGSVNNLAAVVGQEANGENAATGIFAKMATMQTDLQGAIGEAIDDEVEARDQAIEEALAAYTNTTDMKNMMGNIINSLALTMENNQFVLKLGGNDGLPLTSVALNVANDDDITGLLASLE